MYDSRGLPPPPPRTGQHQPYSPKLHAQMAAGQAAPVPAATRPSDAMSATYIPTGETYGEGVGIPGFGVYDAASFLHSQASSQQAKPPQNAIGSSSGPDYKTVATSMEEPAPRERPLPATSQPTSTSASSTIPPEVAAQWPLDTVLIWLAQKQFSKDWQETFKSLDLHGAQFLELGSLHGGRGNFSMMHQKVYPALAWECSNSGTGWDQQREREEGRRMRGLIRSIVTGKAVASSKLTGTLGRPDSVTLGIANHLSYPTPGPDHQTDSPSVSPYIGPLPVLP